MIKAIFAVLCAVGLVYAYDWYTPKYGVVLGFATFIGFIFLMLIAICCLFEGNE